MISFNNLPSEIQSYIFDLARNPFKIALISKEIKVLVNNQARLCFDTLASSQDDVPLLLKSTIAQISKDSSISPLERIKKLYEVVRNAGYDDSRPFESLQPEQIKNAFEELEENQDQALLSIFPMIVMKTSLSDPCITSAKAARIWINKNLFAISKVTELDLDEYNLKVLPSEITLFTQLKQLFLMSNELNALPQKLWQLSKLEILDVSKNKLKRLPKEI